jgi:hypothetical protein
VANNCGQILWMGCYLHRALGDTMVIFGLAFNRGEFQAVELPFSSGRGLRTFAVGPPSDMSLDVTLKRAGLSVAAVDLRARPVAGPVAEWFAQPQETRSIGAGFSDQAAASSATPLAAPQLFDALLFVDSTSAARARPGGRRGPTAPLSSPTNLGFEDLDADGRPTGWIAPPSLSDFDFSIASSRDHPAEGHRAALIARAPGRHYGETYGSLAQSVDATPFRGHRMRLRAMVRTTPADAASRAYLWVRTVRPDQFMFAADGNVRGSRPTTARAWTALELEVDVPADAVSLRYGLALVGNGRAWIDAANLAVMP